MDYAERIYAALFNPEDGYARDFFTDVARIAEALEVQNRIHAELLRCAKVFLDVDSAQDTPTDPRP